MSGLWGVSTIASTGGGHQQAFGTTPRATVLAGQNLRETYSVPGSLRPSTSRVSRTRSSGLLPEALLVKQVGCTALLAVCDSAPKSAHSLRLQVQTFKGTSPPKWDWITKPPRRRSVVKHDSFGVSTVSFDAPSWFGNSQFHKGASSRARRKKPKYILDGDVWMMEPPESCRDYEAQPVQHARPSQLDFTTNRLYGGKATACNSRQPQARRLTDRWPESARDMHHTSSDMSLLTSSAYGGWLARAGTAAADTAPGLLCAPCETPRKPLRCPDTYAPIPKVTASNWRSTLPRLAQSRPQRQAYAHSLARQSMGAAPSRQRAAADSTAACVAPQASSEAFLLTSRTYAARELSCAHSRRVGSLSSRRTRTPGKL